MSGCLQIDLGNSSAKWRLVQGESVLARGKFNPAEASALEGIPETPQQVWISSVASAGVENALAAMLMSRWNLEAWFARTTAQCADLVNSYSDPSRMGVDRWLAMLGARAHSKARLCVVDSGSATTIDIVGEDGIHEGGYIIPGAGLMEQALLRDTDRVRFDEAAEYALDPGRSTAEAVRNGIALAQAGAVRMALEAAAEPEPQLFYCGGGGELLHGLVGRSGKLVPDLVFEGLAIMAAECGS
ncbi:type III pantothenate kinase [Haliea sp. E17]|uniref:type III pantothenate kinase n=1 Tax=Haliea sp. E17 TaxID=3401576 RepID=UPI003AAA23DB